MTSTNMILLTFAVFFTLYVIGGLIKYATKSKHQLENDENEFVRFLTCCSVNIESSETVLQISFLIDPKLCISLKYDDTQGKSLINSFTMQNPNDVVNFKSNYGFNLPYNWQEILIKREFNNFKSYAEGVNGLKGCLQESFIKQFHYSKRVIEDVS